MKSVSIVVQQDAMVPLDRWLATELSRAIERPVPRGLTRKAIVTGLVAVGGRIVRDPGLMLRRGPSVFVRTLEWVPPRDASAPLRVLFEDAWLIAVDKPAGLATHETKDAARASLTAQIERHLGRRVFVHHRLDAGTSGVVLFAKAPDANASLAKSFAKREADKVYLALIERPPIDWPSSMTIDSPLRVLDNGTVRVDVAGLPALTRIRVLDRRAAHLLVETKPVTGRKHQIRVHLASAGAPVVGDARYGSGATGGLRLMLHAERLELDHPVTGKRLIVVSPRPREFSLRREGAAGSKGSLSRSEQPHRREASSPAARASQALPPRAAPRSVPPSRKGTKPRRPARAAARGSRH